MQTLGVVIPTLNEEKTLPGILSDIGKLTLPATVVIADGGSTDDTAAVAARHGARVVPAPRGRGPQLNAGAASLDTEWLLFVHADVRMPPDARTALERGVAGRADAAVFALAIDARGLWPRVMEVGARVRNRLGGLPYGDQGLLVRRSQFVRVGGYPDIPIMEDVAIVRALRRLGPIQRLPAALRVSPRRWQREGPFRTWMRNTVLLAAWLVGVSPHRLARWYRPEAG
ncbi:MAG: TIGR04283 family arsenosugar biosynthesis glycosyltransferase [Gemmatimonadales bacterium]|jgi:rSAM/selenodomain-associated transferase 2|nr:TIGR04283 family arsenosugar biosynthesis glycosyltransferase [Gemmatimonadales bacterium]